MTTGEKIQYYRKRSGLSQEELGQKMLVSRQTVSLWEMDKTIPSVDNLILLKEIFSVSVDDILSGSEPSEEKAEEPKERYTFNYGDEDMRAIFKKSSAALIKRAVIFTLGCILLFVASAAVGVNETVIGLVLGAFLIGIISHIKGYFAYRKAFRGRSKSVLISTYSYEVFERYFVLKLSKNGEITKTLKIYFDEVDKIHSFGNYIILQISDQSYIIKKDALAQGSAFFALGERAEDKRENKAPPKALRTVSILLFVLSFCTLIGAMFSVIALSQINYTMEENMWAFFLFLPVPIASVVFGFYLKKNGYKYKKNVIAGFIMAALLTVYGSFSFVFAGYYSHSEEPILQTEQLLGIDIPVHSQINTQDWTRGTQSVPRGYIYYTSDIYFDRDAVTEFEKDLEGDEKWLPAIPNELVGITSWFCDVQSNDYFIIYNKDTGEFNQLPKESGSYVFVNVIYDTEENTMKLVEYKIEYAK